MKTLRVLIAKPGLDGHELGAMVVARGLRDAGMEVIYSGPRQTPEMIVDAAIQEDVDVIGLSVLSGTHKEYCREVRDLLEQRNTTDIRLIVGGIVPHEDVEELKQMGVGAVFGPGTDIQAIVDYLLHPFIRAPGR